MISKRIAEFIIISVMIVFAAGNDVLACDEDPVARFECTSDSAQCHPGNFQFDASESYDPDGGDIESYKWTITSPGHMEPETEYGGPTHSFTFSEPGTYCISLRVKDDEGDWSENECWDIVCSVQINGVGILHDNWPIEWMDTFPPTFGISAIGGGGSLVQSWSGGGDPATQQGGATFTTRWYETGKYTVTVNTDCGSFSKDVNVFDLDLIVEGLTEEEELNPGKFMVVNNDDDDSNSVPDLSDSGPVADEDDLVEITLSIVPELKSGIVTFSAGSSNGGEVKFWLSEEKGEEFILKGQGWDLSEEELPEKIYAEGCSSGEVILWFYYDYVFDEDWALLNIEQPDCAHPIPSSFEIYYCCPTSDPLLYGLDVYYHWQSDSGKLSDLSLCFLSESFDDASGFTPPFYDIGAPTPVPEVPMSTGAIVDTQGYKKTKVSTETWGYAWWFQTWTYECKRCGHKEDLIVDSETKFHVYEKYDDDYWIETTVSSCSGEQDMDDN